MTPEMDISYIKRRQKNRTRTHSQTNRMTNCAANSPTSIHVNSVLVLIYVNNVQHTTSDTQNAIEKGHLASCCYSRKSMLQIEIYAETYDSD